MQVSIDFYNARRRAAMEAQPNEAHHAIAALENDFDVQVITHIQKKATEGLPELCAILRERYGQK